MKHFITLILFLLSITVYGQVVQSGYVVELSSGNKALSGVEILVSGANPTLSDEKGEFRLQFTREKEGNILNIIEIYKKDYEVVNIEDLRECVISSSSPLKIVLCKKETLETAKRNYYRIGENRYILLYEEALDELKKEELVGRLDKMEFDLRLKEINEHLEQALVQLYYYADIFAKINKDELSELDAKAMNFLEQGKVDEAIRVYEESGILEEFNEKIHRLINE